MADAIAWARIGHSLIHHAEAVRTDQSAVRVLNVADTPWYVQWHGEEDGAVYIEAASGLYDGNELGPKQQQLLRSIGWDAPGEGWGKDQVLNWSRLYEPPVDLYDLVRSTVATLRDVFGAEPDAILVGGA